MPGECGVDNRQRDVYGRAGRGRGEEAWCEERRKEILPQPKSKGGNMGQVTSEQVNLMLRLYEERREPRLREAREWFSANFHVKNEAGGRRVCPPGRKENADMRMGLRYWVMGGGTVNRGLVEE